MIGEISYLQFGLLCVFAFGFMGLAIYLGHEVMKQRKPEISEGFVAPYGAKSISEHIAEVERSGAKSGGSVEVQDGFPPAGPPSRYAHDWEPEYDVELSEIPRQS